MRRKKKAAKRAQQNSGNAYRVNNNSRLKRTSNEPFIDGYTINMPKIPHSEKGGNCRIDPSFQEQMPSAVRYAKHTHANVIMDH